MVNSQKFISLKTELRPDGGTPPQPSEIVHTRALQVRSVKPRLSRGPDLSPFVVRDGVGHW